MKYPNNIKKSYKKEINYKNRGMNLESLINEACKYYVHNDLAIIYKKPTPIGVVDVDYKNGAVINKAYFKEPSTLDYNGIYKGKYIEFDAKECKSTTSFPLSNIKKHQLNHIDNIIRHGGITFLIIFMNNAFYLLEGKVLLEYIYNNDRKSIPFEFMQSNGHKIPEKYFPRIDYLKIVDELIRSEL